jgi:pimeloyl-ACP methyl ester carboxylesterase
MSSSLLRTEEIPRASSRDPRELQSTAQGHRHLSSLRQPARLILWAILIPLLLPGLILSPHQASAQPLENPETVPRLEWGSCDFPIPSGFTEGTDALCGYLVVPESRDIPDGPTLRLAVLVLKARNETEHNSPLVILQGGPGGSAIDDLVYHFTSSPILDDRDIVLIDQRGSGYSEPRLDCPELIDLLDNSSSVDAEEDRLEKLSNDALIACIDRLTQDGINLEAYTTEENAADIEDLRKALGYEKIDLYGVSYGAELAVAVMSTYPSGIRSVILDSPVPGFGEGPASERAAIQAVIHACDRDPECRRAYPRLTEDLQKAIDRLDEKPVTIHIPHSETGKIAEWRFDGDDFVSDLASSLRSPFFVSSAPMIIHHAGNGQYGILWGMNSAVTTEMQDNIAWGMYFSIRCGTKARYFTADYMDEDLEDPSDDNHEDIADPEDFDCAVLTGGNSLSTESAQEPNLPPPSSIIPTLVLPGRFDPLTIPDYAHWIAEQLPISTAVTIENAGHGTIGSSKCVDAMMAQFLNDPLEPVNTDCTRELAEFHFSTTDQLVRLPIVEIGLGIQMRSPLVLGLVGVYGFSWILLVLGTLITAIILPTIRCMKHSRQMIRLIIKWKKQDRPAPSISEIRKGILAHKGIIFITSILLLGYWLIWVSKDDSRLNWKLALSITVAFCLPTLVWSLIRWLAEKRWIKKRLIHRARILSRAHYTFPESETGIPRRFDIPIPKLLTWPHLLRVISGVALIYTYGLFISYISNNFTVHPLIEFVFYIYPVSIFLLIAFWPTHWRINTKVIAWHGRRRVKKPKKLRSPWLVRKTPIFLFGAALFPALFLFNLYQTLEYFYYDWSSLFGYPRDELGVTALVGGAFVSCILGVMGTAISYRRNRCSKTRVRFQIAVVASAVIVVVPLSILVFLGHF